MMPASASSSAFWTRFAARTIWMPIVCVVLACGTSKITASQTEVPTKQLFDNHCEKCHSGAEAEGDFTVASLTGDFNDRQNRERWLTVLEQLREGNMPPKDEPRPPMKDVQSVMDWISTQAGKAEIARREREGRVVMRRLNRAEYANTVRDLLNVEVDLADLLPLDTSTNSRSSNWKR